MPHRIALLIHALYGGGAEKLMSQLASRWAADHELHLITWSRVDTDRYAIPAGVHRIGLDLMRHSRGVVAGLLANLNRVRVLRRTLRAIDPDFILSFSDQMNILSLQASRPLGRPHWISEHSHPGHQRLSPFWERWRAHTYRHCSGCHVLTEDIAQYMSRWIELERLVVIPPAIDASQFGLPTPHPMQPLGPSPPDAAATPTVSPENNSPSAAGRRPTVLYVGRLSEEKGIPILLDAWRQLQTLIPDWQLRIAGDGPLRPALERSAVDLARVEFMGWVDRPIELYHQADIFVLPSRYEGFPVALLEAMASGLACVASECSTAVRALEDRAGGCSALQVVRVGSAEALVTALRELMQDETFRRRLSQRAVEVAQRYSWARIGPRWDAILAGH